MFQTIEKDVSKSLEVKRSKFIANAFYIESEDEAKQKIEGICKKYFDAKHHVYAYKLTNIERCSDDGEPQGTAGTPLLDIIKRKNLNNILVVVTRYFGGILLGTGGLVKAYSDAFIMALNTANIVSKDIGIEAKVTLKYENLEKFKYLCSNLGLEIEDSKYDLNILVTICGKKENFERLLENYNLIIDSQITNENKIITCNS